MKYAHTSLFCREIILSAAFMKLEFYCILKGDFGNMLEIKI